MPLYCKSCKSPVDLLDSISYCEECADKLVDKTSETTNNLEEKLRVMLIEQIEYFCATCTRYLDLKESTIDPTLLWKPLNELPTAIANLETDENDELRLNAFILQARFSGEKGPGIATDVAAMLRDAITLSFKEGNDAFGNRVDFEMGCLQIIHDLAKAFGFKEIQSYAEAFRFSDIGG